MSRREFFSLTWVEYELLSKRENYQIEIGWVYVREQMAQIYNVNKGKGKSAIRGREIINLSFDSFETDVQPPTPEEAEEIVRKLSKYMPKKK